MAKLIIACLYALSVIGFASAGLKGQTNRALIKTPLSASGLSLERPTHPGAFFDVLGRRAAVFGYEHRGFEAWAYPLKILEDFRLSFSLEGYPLDVPAEDMLATINTRPEATIFTYSHAAFTIRQTLFAPIDQPAVVMLLDVRTTLPMRITASFRPRLRLMWPAGLMTANVSWNETDHLYTLTEESRRFAGAIGAPAARDLSLMPYQEEPRDVAVSFAIDVSVQEADSRFIPIVIAGSVKGADDAAATCRKVLADVLDLYAATVSHYREIAERTTSVRTPVEQLDSAFAWAKVGIDKGVVTNPLLGTGLVAGYRTSGESERPGFAWFFGRDSLWTSLASTSIGDFETVRMALEFLEKFQRDDGKIPHEISQSASLIPWFTEYPYSWASADATPLYVIAHADYWRASGDVEFLKANWPSILKAYRFTAATDSDGNALIENTGVGHGWVEGGALYPAHEEIYMQGLWIEALRGLAELAEVMNDATLVSSAGSTAERVREAVERVYWLDDRGFYAFATAQPRKSPSVAEPGPRRETRQKRLDALAAARLIDEDTVLPAVPLWWRTLDERRAQQEIDRLGSGALATDWGARLLSARSGLYDPLSYHYGSVWPLFTGWAAMAAYQYGRPHVGYQAVTANALLTYDGALGYVTELLSGDFNAPFGRSSHHQIWSEAMVVTPLVRGLLGVHTARAGTVLHFAPQLPADWDRVSLNNVAAGTGRYDLKLERGGGRMTITLDGRPGAAPARAPASPGLHEFVVAPAFPLDAVVQSASVNGRPAPIEVTRRGDVQQARLTIKAPPAHTTIAFRYVEGSDVYAQPLAPAPGAENGGLRILRSTAARDRLRLLLEGRGGRRYRLVVRTPHRIDTAPGVTVTQQRAADVELEIAFEGPATEYVRREIVIPFLGARGGGALISLR
jgi:glycogen debranching enzyme